MVTVRQFSRGVGRTLRAMERESRRAQRQQFLHQQALAKQTMLNASAHAADQYDQLIELLTRCHRVPFVRKDWAAVADLPPPPDPPYNDAREQAAATVLARYKPSWFAKVFGLASGQRDKLVAAREEARKRDVEAHRDACGEAAKRRNEIAAAQSVVSLNSQALLDAVTQHANLNDAAIEAVNILAVGGRVIVVVDALEQEDMPTQSVSLLKSGKASHRQKTASKVQELHRDNICSSAVRIATEFLKVLPIEAVEVVVHTDLLDRASGHITSQPVLYARITAQALEMVNLVMADAAPLAERLGAQFTWTRKDGFRPIDLRPFNLPPELLPAEPLVN